MMKKLVVYIGRFVFPFEDAVAKRAYGLGLLFKDAGYDAAFIGESADVPPHSMSEDEIVNGFMFCNIHKAASATEHYDYFFDLNLIRKKLVEWDNTFGILAVVFCGMKCALLADGVVNICKKLKIPTVADSMDWLETNTGNLLFDLIKQADITYEIKTVNRKVSGLICISEFLAEYYKQKGKKTLVIPPISPYAGMSLCMPERDHIPTLVYAGIPCRLGKPLLNPSDAKDRLDVALELLYRIHKRSINFFFSVYGLTAEQYLVAFPHQELLVRELERAHKLVFFGRVSSKKVAEEVVKADFTLLLRDRNRVTMAGFPTKLSESICLGTPVITTDTSDVCKYICDGREAIILDICDLRLAEDRLAAALSLPAEERIRRKNFCLDNTAFVPESYSEQVKAFFENLI